MVLVGKVGSQSDVFLMLWCVCVQCRAGLLVASGALELMAQLGCKVQMWDFQVCQIRLRVCSERVL